MSEVRVDIKANVLRVFTPYDPVLVAALKSAIPYTQRSWSKADKCWNVDPAHAATVHKIIHQYTGVDLKLPPNLPGRTLTVSTKILDVRYIGRVKVRPDGSESAFGWSGGEWSVIFPGDMLRSWFGEDPSRPSEAQTLYATLGVKQTADIQEIKRAHRRLAKIWHSDISKESDADKQFRAIQQAWEILSTPATRARYDAGLALEATLGTADVHRIAEEWQPPLRCGYVMASGRDVLSRFIVDAIYAWEDIKNNAGETLVTTWPVDSDHFEERWVQL